MPTNNEAGCPKHHVPLDAQGPRPKSNRNDLALAGTPTNIPHRVPDTVLK